MDKIPRKLARPPILEATAEIRFENTLGLGSGSIISGALFSALKDQFPKFEPHPSSQLPAALKDADPNLRYLPTHRLVGEAEVVLVGDRVLGQSRVGGYPGWDAFKASVLKTLETAKHLEVIGAVERVSVKYVNLIESPLGSDQLGLTEITISLGSHRLGSESATLRTEFIRGRAVSIVQVVSQAKTLATPERASGKEGLILDIDTIINGPFSRFWDELPTILDEAHSLAEEMFFGLVKEDTVNGYGPEF